VTAFALTAEYLGGPTYALEDVPRSTQVLELALEVASAVNREVPQTPGCIAWPLWVQHWQGAAAGFLEPDLTLAEAGLRDGAAICVAAGPSFAIARRYEGDVGALSTDAFRCGIPAMTAAEARRPSTFVRRVVFTCDRNGTLTDLLALALLHWPRDAGLIRELALLVESDRDGHGWPPKVPLAWPLLRANERSLLERLWA
jgi:hypothetical protein